MAGATARKGDVPPGRDEHREQGRRVKPTLPADIGRRVRAVRLEHGKTLREVYADWSPSFGSRFERGEISCNLSSLLQIAERLGVSPAEFFVTDREAAAAAELILNDARKAQLREQPSECLRLLDLLDVSGPERGELLSLRGWALLELSRTVEAVPVLQEALPLVETGGDARLVVETRGRLAVAHYRLQDYGESRRIMEPALAWAEQTGDDVLVGRVVSMLGNLHYVQHDPDTAIAHYELARRKFEGSITDLGSLAAVYSGLSNAHWEKGEVDAAVRYSRLALGIYEAHAWQRQAALELNNLAQRYIDAGKLDRAIETANRAVERALTAQASDLHALARTTRAGALLRRGSIQEAGDEAVAVLQLASVPGTRAEIDAWIVLAEVAEREGNTDRTDAMYSKALAALKGFGHMTRYADAALAYSRMLKARGDRDGALHWLEEAAECRVRTARAAY